MPRTPQESDVAGGGAIPEVSSRLPLQYGRRWRRRGPALDFFLQSAQNKCPDPECVLRIASAHSRASVRRRLTLPPARLPAVPLVKGLRRSLRSIKESP